MRIAGRLQDLAFSQIFRGRRRGRLVRHYFFISVILISGGLITSGLLEIYFRYRESREQIALLHREVAAGTAFKIERFVQEIEGAMRAATKSREIILKGLTPDYKFELEKLLTIARAITEVVALDAEGFVRVRASRLRAILPKEERDLSSSGVFHQAKEGKSYFGPVYFVRGSEPYMTIAAPIERFAGEVIGALQAEVNLKYIWDVISGIKVGRAGYAYAVSGSGDLIAHQEISLVLQQRNLAHLEQVKAAFRTKAGVAVAESGVANDLQGNQVFSSSAVIPSLSWAVIVESPLKEAYEPLYASIFRTSGLLLLGLGVALLASLLVERRVVGPLRALREGVERIGRGDLSSRLQIKTGDEIEILAEEFNKMTGQLQELYANLEQKVEARTRELSEALEQQTATSEILRVISSSPRDLQPVFENILADAARLCDAKNGAIFTFDGEAFHLAAPYNLSPELEAYLQTTPIYPGRRTALQRAGLERQVVHITDILADSECEYPQVVYEREGTRTTMAVPMLKENTLIGAITLHRREVKPFSDKQIALLKTFADQAVIAIENVRLFQEIEEKNRQLEIANRHKSQFLANVSHELRTPLNAIIGFTRLVLRKTEGQIPELQRENLQKVLISAEQLLRLINGLLDLSKIEAGRMEVYIESFRLDEVIDKAASTVEPMLRDGQVRLIREISPDLPLLNTDREKFEHILLNLLSNAAKFTEKGEIKVSACQENGVLKVAISDTGIGMEKESLQYIFEEFRRVDITGTKKYSGTGLGLAIVKKLVTILGGDIRVESELGQGSTFTVRFPISFSGR